MTIRQIEGNIVDINNRKIFPGRIQIDDGRIRSIEQVDKSYENYLMPGFIDAHIHIESSMVVPYEFAREALKHGTVATISDPHEIANVLGIKGVEYMIDNARNAKLKFHFGAPSCVPATDFETSGAVIDAKGVEELLKREDIHYLSEMMNYPGVLNEDQEVMKKLRTAKFHGKPIDGHAPGLKGLQAEQYISHGITTDHECFTIEEALDKLSYGMKILIREGSAAKNYEALHLLIKNYSDQLMFCSDDKHPDDLLKGHINDLVKRSLGLGYDLFDVLQIACINPVEHYNMQVGTLRVGDPADLIVVQNLTEFQIEQVYINGEKVCEQDKTFLPRKTHPIVNQFNIRKLRPADFLQDRIPDATPVIKAIDGELITEKLAAKSYLINSSEDILNIAVINRYRKAPVAMGRINGFGIKEGAMASTVAHDSHNILVVGSAVPYMCQAVNMLIDSKGGLSVVGPEVNKIIPLPIAGIMSDAPCSEVAEQYTEIDQITKLLGCKLNAPFMTLSFMALLVIPKIKMSDKGIFDAETFTFYSKN